MRLLILGAPILNAAFRQLGHHVTQLGPGQDSDVVLTHPLTLERLLERMDAPPHAILHMDNGNLPQVLGLERATVPTLFYSIDTFCNPWHIPYAAAFDHVLVAQFGQLELFTQQGFPVTWMPLFASQMAEPDEDFSARDVPVSFVGTLNPRNIPTRQPFLQRFRKLSPLVAMQGNYVPLFARSRIVLNQTAFSELNYRCFEAAGCGAALLMEAVPDLERVFTPGETILPPYPKDDADAAAAAVREWTATPERLEQLARVAKAGYELVAARHTAQCRAVEIVAHVERLIAENAPAARFAGLARRRVILSTAYAILVLELEGPFYVAHREFYSRAHAELCSTSR